MRSPVEISFQWRPWASAVAIRGPSTCSVWLTLTCVAHSGYAPHPRPILDIALRAHADPRRATIGLRDREWPRSEDGLAREIARPKGGQNGQEESHPSAALVLQGRGNQRLAEGAHGARGRKGNRLARPEAPRQGRPLRADRGCLRNLRRRGQKARTGEGRSNLHREGYNRSRDGRSRGSRVAGWGGESRPFPVRVTTEVQQPDTVKSSVERRW